MQDSSSEPKIKIEDEVEAEPCNREFDPKEEVQPNQRGGSFELSTEDTHHENAKPETIVKSSVAEEKEDTKKKRSWIPGKSWCWHLAEDGTPLTVDATVKKDRGIQTESVGSADIMDTTMAPTETSVKHQDSNQVAAAAAANNRTQTQPTDVDRASRKKRKTNDCSPLPTTSGKVETGDDSVSQRRGWHWIRNSDGSLVTVNSLSEVPSVAGKRKRGIQRMPQPSDHDSTQTTDNETNHLYINSEYYLSDNDSISDSSIYDGDSDDEGEGEDDNYSNCDSHSFLVPSKEHSANYQQKWEEKFQLLVEYKNKHKTTIVPQSDPTLGSWVNTQRAAHKKGALSKYRMQRLNSIGFVWKIGNEKNDAIWEEKFQLLVEYKNKHKTVSVPWNDPTLGSWIRIQRNGYRRRIMSKYRMQRLNSIGFVWKVGNETNDAIWEEKFQLLVEYKNKHKTVSMPWNDPTLGSWIGIQRTGYRQGTLSKYRLQRLNSIGFVWKVGNERYDVIWEEKFNLLVEYKNKHKTTVVPRSDLMLGNWIQTQRVTYNKGTLSKYRVQRLESIGFEWKAKDSIPWIEMYKRLKEYKSQYGSTWVPTTYKADPKLANWVCAQRQGCKEQYRIDLLNKIGFEWGTKCTDWGVMYQRLVAYQKKNGTTRVPTKYKADPKLANWVCSQRQGCKEQYRIDLLNKIGFVWDTRDIKRNNWEAMYQRLVQFKKKNGTTRVPTTYKADPSLAKWVCTQRQGCKEQYRIDLLNKIGFDWGKKLTDWGVMYQRLVEFKKKNGTTLVPQYQYKADPKLANWVRTQRMHCKEKYRVDLLNKIGFVWDARFAKRNTNWEVMYQQLLAYKKKNGTTCVPQSYKADPKLALWVSNQRKTCKEKYRVDLLNKIGFVWDTRDIKRNNWEAMYQRLVQFKKKNGTTRVPTEYKADPKLGSWVSTQRKDCKEKYRIDLLNKIGFVWNARF